MFDTIELINDEGKKEKLVVNATFHIDDVEYAVLSYPNSDEGMIYSIERDEKGNPTFNIVENRDEIQEVIDVYEAMADDII